jgi:hypothetical protein
MSKDPIYMEIFILQSHHGVHYKAAYNYVIHHWVGQDPDHDRRPWPKNYPLKTKRQL